ncbi:unnamed protein product [Lactuca virosa]|uniref:Uncharacterized protein n=1 Tax=Lactuca virosa TaxID=75947 RepID=A0AAU9LP74_9ASTR|nr:unnamed protein product [Lactuca virosa]
MNPSIFLKFADCVNFLGVHSLQLLYPPTVCEKSFCILTNQSSCASSVVQYGWNLTFIQFVLQQAIGLLQRLMLIICNKSHT